ncbi:hypothetical protein [Desulfoscipio geothermicus]|uniref:GIY-YIG catalytic domain-containing protein n=1 Tax=Desulfoscipio geothermicus DSM 3669 TaxID=1121426 RepID=A0A1I6E983_9FIRM|nr:hypothetical protein [Desulfoscipio geothermicus]SFR14207.1 hypothetical protein SAMN05660706_13029 [Desulfoscipio geothermicus DSM 3669]
MSIKVGGYTFEGPYSSTNSLEDRSGVYAILCTTGDANTYSLIDVGESSEVKTRVENHDRAGCWSENCLNTLRCAVYYTPHKQQAGRKEIEQEIRDKYSIPCGER